MIYEYLIFFAIAFIVAFSATPVAKKLAFKLGAVDVPKDARRMHKKPIARLGGISIFAGFAVALIFGFICEMIGIGGIIPSRKLLGMLIGVLIIIVIGIFDDIKPLSAKFKLVFQIMAAMSVVFIGDTRISILSNPFPGMESTQLQLNDFISYPLTVIWIVGITNAINLIDGLDGLAAGVSSISYLSLFFVSMLIPDTETALLTIILAGGTLGFLPYNFNPAKIFMGDTGSTFLGFTLATISIQGMLKSFTVLSLAIPMLVLWLPIFDTIFTILRRLFSGKPIMQPDRGHLHHRLIDMGLSQKQSVIVIYTASATMGLSAIVLADKGAVSAIVLVVAVSVFIIAGAKYMNEMDDVVPETTADFTGQNQVAKMIINENGDRES